MITPGEKTIFLKLFRQKEEVRAGGIIVPGRDEPERDQGEVSYVGAGCWVRPGQRILFKHYESHEVKVGGEDYTVIRDQDVLAVID